MDFGTIGAGAIGRGIATHLVTAGHRVVLGNRRGPDAPTGMVTGTVTRLGPSTTAGTVAGTAAAETVLLAVRWQDIPAAPADVSSWDGRSLADTGGQVTGLTPAHHVDLGAETGGESVARHAPGAVKVFTTPYAQDPVPDPRHAEGRRFLFCAGDGAGAKAAFGSVADELGFAPVHAGR